MRTRVLFVLTSVLLIACDVGGDKPINGGDSIQNAELGVELELNIGSLQTEEGDAAASPGVWLAAGMPQLATSASDSFVGARLHEKWATVEGLRFRLLQVYADGPAVDFSAVADWTDAPRIVEVAHGFAESVTGLGRIKPGSYTSASLHLDNWFAVKGYAFMPNVMAPQPVSGEHTVADPLVRPSMTIWTTTAGMVTAPGLVQVTDFTDYNYLEVQWLSADIVDGATADSTADTARIMTSFEAPVEITTTAKAPRLTLRLDTYNLLMALDGDSYIQGGAAEEWYPSGSPIIRPLGRLTGFAFLNEPNYMAETYEWVRAGIIPAEGELLPPDISSVDELWVKHGTAFTMLLSSDRVPLRGEIKQTTLFMSIHKATANGDGTYKLVGGGPLHAEDVQSDYYIDGFKPLAVGDAPVEATCNCVDGALDGLGSILIRRVAR